VTRPFDFKTPAQGNARARQMGLCAVCGEDLTDLSEHAHHVVPNQSGTPGHPDHAWLASPENCVVLCETCHERVHEDGRYRTGAVAPPDYFQYSHGKNQSAHTAWVKAMTGRLRAIWP
jgi:5-methylcytosine-specific restriction endonuclease McrA